MYCQRTVKRKIVIEGKGVHSGKISKIIFEPAPKDTGIIIKQKGLSDFIKCDIDNVVDTQNQVSLGNGKFTVKTVEHILSALRGLGITNCFIETDSDEMPIMDGSAYPIIEYIEAEGVLTQKSNIKPLKIPHPVWVQDMDKYLIILPDDRFRISYHVSYPNTALSSQYAYFQFSKHTYVKEIAKARTFGFYEEWQALQKQGLALGSCLENTIVYSKNGLMNSHLRYENECVRHKILDLIGDFSLLGMPIKGYVIANKSGHKLDIELIHKVRDIMMNNVFTKKDILQQYKIFEKKYASILP